MQFYKLFKTIKKNKFPGFKPENKKNICQRYKLFGYNNENIGGFAHCSSPTNYGRKLKDCIMKMGL